MNQSAPPSLAFPSEPEPGPGGAALSRLARVADALLHPRLRVGRSEDLTFGRVAVWFVLFGSLAFAVLAVLAAVRGDTFSALFRASVVLINIPLAVLLHRVGSATAVKAYATFQTWTVVTAAVLLTGGATSRVLYLYALLPFLTAGLGGPRLALAGLLVALASIGAVYLLHGLDVALQPLGPQGLVLEPASLAVATALVLGMTAVILRSRRAVRREIAAAVRALVEANGHAASARTRLERARSCNRTVLERVGDGFHARLARLAHLADTVAGALPAALHDHARMVTRGAQGLLSELTRFVGYSRDPSRVPALEASASAPLPVPRAAPHHDRLWGLIDRLLPPTHAEATPEQRAQARVVAAILVVVTVFAVLMAGVDAFLPSTSSLLDLSVALVALLLLLLLRRPGGLIVAVVVLTALLAFVGAGQLAFRHEPGNPTMAWVLIMGLLPALHGRVLTAALSVAATLVAAALLAAPAPAAPSLTPPGDVLGLCLASWAVVRLVQGAHFAALAELRQELARCHAEERRMEAATRALGGEARETEFLLSAMAHELRTALNGVVGLAELLALEPGTSPVRDELDELRGTGRGVARAVDTLLCVARARVEGAEAPRLVDLKGLLDAAAERARQAAPELAVRGGRGPTCPRVVSAPLGPLRAALDQIVGSAVEAGVQDLGISSACRDDSLELAVSGRFAPGRTGPAGELALGIALARALVEAAGGALAEDRSPDGAWCVWARLPAAPASSMMVAR